MTADVPAAEFSSRRAIAPMMWAFLSIAVCELAVVHFLIALWSHSVAVIISLITVPVLIWLVRAIASLRTMPSTISDSVVTFRAGRMKSVAVPLSQIAGQRSVFSAEEMKDEGVLNLALIAHPNVLLDLAFPILRKRRAYHTVAHRLDDPAAFTTALARSLALGRDGIVA